MDREYRFEVVTLLVSPGHAYFGRAKDGAAHGVRTDLVDAVEVVADKGIRGDRLSTPVTVRSGFGVVARRTPVSGWTRWPGRAPAWH